MQPSLMLYPNESLHQQLEAGRQVVFEGKAHRMVNAKLAHEQSKTSFPSYSHLLTGPGSKE